MLFPLKIALFLRGIALFIQISITNCLICEAKSRDIIPFTLRIQSTKRWKVRNFFFRKFYLFFIWWVWWYGVEGVLCSGQPGRQTQQEWGDPVDLLQVQLELEDLAWFDTFRGLDNGGHIPSKLVVQRHLLFQGQLSSPKDVKLMTDSTQQLLLRKRGKKSSHFYNYTNG